jgi:hypothetical protein
MEKSINVAVLVGSLRTLHAGVRRVDRSQHPVKGSRRVSGRQCVDARATSVSDGGVSHE